MSSRQNIEQAWKAAQLDNLDELKELVPALVSPNASTFSSENHAHTLLMCAAAHGSLTCARYLVEKGANVNAKNFAGYTALHWAAYTGRDETLLLLKQSGANIEARTEDGKTPLIMAAFRGNIDFISELLKLKADINAVSCDGWNAMHYAIMSNQKATCNFLFSHNIDISPSDSKGRTMKEFAALYKRNWYPPLEEKYSKVQNNE
ncbi:ankyrin repeat protein [Histomonas meleagridis]|uniref:ankyrin repeat protein n=1 Tax=Histomonas meleagridis TaxID=135588 RepID=UPI003559E94F|nr:ankyrin repeat protein [Histomonas meleagridis]KAH0800877.1 ankyrin repeat protein [Histomonas meleagridis]